MADETVMVQAGPEAAPGRVVLSERDTMHPENEVYIAAPAEGEAAVSVKVGRTAAIEAKLRSGELVEIKGGKAAKPTDEK